MAKEAKGFSTTSIHGSSMKDQYGSLIMPIYNSSITATATRPRAWT